MLIKAATGKTEFILKKLICSWKTSWKLALQINPFWKRKKLYCWCYKDESWGRCHHFFHWQRAGAEQWWQQSPLVGPTPLASFVIAAGHRRMLQCLCLPPASWLPFTQVLCWPPSCWWHVPSCFAVRLDQTLAGSGICSRHKHYLPSPENPPGAGAEGWHALPYLLLSGVFGELD